MNFDYSVARQTATRWFHASLLVCLTCLTAQSAAAQSVFINEFHYDNTGTDSGEAIEIAGPAGTDLSGWSVVLYNGSNGSIYNTTNLSGVIANQDGGYGTVVFSYPSNGIQNGAPDGIALVDPSTTVVQFLSYEGSFAAVGGPADGMTSTDIGIAETGSTAVGDSLQLTGSGSVYTDFAWAAPQPNTFAAVNTGQVFAVTGAAFINEIHYDNSGADTGEGFEIAGNAGLDLTGWSVIFYNGNGGVPYGSIDLSGTIPDQQNGYGTLAFAASGLQNGSPDGLALVDASTTVVQFLSYEGSFTAVGGAADGMSSTDIGVAEASSSTIGDSLQLAGTGTQYDDFSWATAQPNTFGAINTGQSFGGGGEPQGPPFVINEFLADPANDLPGDANGDGVRDSSQDEFIELVNVSSNDIDISGWSLFDGFGQRHIFPAGSVVTANCAIVVFGGGTPAGTFGGAVVQTASSGTLGLNNSGDSITLDNTAGGTVSTSYGGEGGDNQSLTLDPDVVGTAYVKHSTVAGTLFSPGTKSDGSQFSGCDLLPQGPYEIYELQGAGSASPYAGVYVKTENNVVTALSPDGFFIQTPSDRSDSNVDTSDGIFVFQGTAPSVVPGDLVDVLGVVQEFFNFTELSGDPAVTVIGSGAALPAAVSFDSSVPSPDPTAPSCAIEFECYEGMLVEIANGTVGGSNQRYGSDPVAEVWITAAAERPFREPGIEFPGLGIPEIATWDGNPEIFELDPDKLGLPNLIIPAGSHFSATGVIGFDFGDYEIWPFALEVTPAAIPLAVRPRERAEFTVGSLNVYRLFDDINDPAVDGRNDVSNISTAEYERRLTKFVDYIVNVLDAPDVLAVQEAEKLEVLEQLASRISDAHPGINYTAYLEEGNDIGTIDVGFLVKDSVSVDAITQLGKDEIFDFDGSLLNDRPPLLLEGRSINEGADYPFAVIVVHNRSLSSIETSDRVRAKRLAQAESIATKIQAMQTDNPALRLIVVGDFNAFEFSDGYVDAIGVISGSFDPDASLLAGTDYVDPDLINQVLSLPETERYSFVFDGSAQTLDHALTSMALDQSVRGLEYGRGNADAAVDLINDDSTPLRSSDHDGLVLFITKDMDADGVNDDADVCPATVIPETPTAGLGTNRFALTDGDFNFDTMASKGKGPGRSYSTVDTAGCSCAQIVAAEGLGNGHSKFGCSIGVMDNWVRKVTK